MTTHTTRSARLAAGSLALVAAATLLAGCKSGATPAGTMTEGTTSTSPAAMMGETPGAMTSTSPDAMTTTAPDAMMTTVPDAMTTTPPDAMMSGTPDAMSTGH